MSRPRPPLIGSDAEAAHFWTKTAHLCGPPRLPVIASGLFRLFLSQDLLSGDVWRECDMFAETIFKPTFTVHWRCGLSRPFTSIYQRQWNQTCLRAAERAHTVESRVTSVFLFHYLFRTETNGRRAWTPAEPDLRHIALAHAPTNLSPFSLFFCRRSSCLTALTKMFLNDN